MSRRRRKSLSPKTATVTVTAKLSAEQVAWIDRRVAELEEGEGWATLPRIRYGKPTRSSVVRALVEIASRREGLPA